MSKDKNNANAEAGAKLRSINARLTTLVAHGDIAKINELNEELGQVADELDPQVDEVAADPHE